ncbi:cellulose biosynthesis protein BcsD [Acerihabitans arboris]|uniref:Cellulose synthase n=1 Tax=Acerihabitans arboris TaxID=2691583 RepID=A0A845SAA6_9GAMM|nr:cellulose biosynthesis protein BcsD [Acerihabitans arboris]NDL61690.1 cellulose synthase [Acerihabitans arboris]
MNEITQLQPQHDDYLQRRYQAGWHDLVHIMFANILIKKDEVDNHEALRNIGQSLAQWYPLPGCNTVHELEIHLNKILDFFNWGFLKIAPAERELILVHCAWPHAPRMEDEGRWRQASAWVLEGAYSQWLLSQGGENQVPVIWNNQDMTKDVLIFRYALQERPRR